MELEKRIYKMMLQKMIGGDENEDTQAEIEMLRTLYFNNKVTDYIEKGLTNEAKNEIDRVIKIINHTNVYKNHRDHELTASLEGLKETIDDEGIEEAEENTGYWVHEFGLFLQSVDKDMSRFDDYEYDLFNEDLDYDELRNKYINK